MRYCKEKPNYTILKGYFNAEAQKDRDESEDRLGHHGYWEPNERGPRLLHCFERIQFFQNIKKMQV